MSHDLLHSIINGILQNVCSHFVASEGQPSWITSNLHMNFVRVTYMGPSKITLHVLDTSTEGRHLEFPWDSTCYLLQSPRDPICKSPEPHLMFFDNCMKYAPETIPILHFDMFLTLSGKPGSSRVTLVGTDSTELDRLKQKEADM